MRSWASDQRHSVGYVAIGRHCCALALVAAVMRKITNARSRRATAVVSTLLCLALSAKVMLRAEHCVTNNCELMSMQYKSCNKMVQPTFCTGGRVVNGSCAAQQHPG